MAAVDPLRCLPAHRPDPPRRRTWITGAGKAAVKMAAAFTAGYDAPLQGAVVTRHEHAPAHLDAIDDIDILTAGHPVPDEASVVAGARMLEIARQAGPDDRLVFLVSGGASALLVQPAHGITLADKQALTRQLLASGAGIDVINGIRPKLSAIKGGRLAAATRGAEIVILALSDVPGDEIARIGSGPCSPDPVPLDDARRLLDEAGVNPEPACARLLADPGREPLPPDHPVFARCTSRLIGRSAMAVQAAANLLAAAGYRPVIQPEARESARALAAAHAAEVARLRGAGQRVALVSGGETTVALARTDGVGGRNTEYLLALALELESAGITGLHALAADTDGIDGTGPHAGALLGPTTLVRCRSAGHDPVRLQSEHRSRDVFDRAGDLLITGPTGTNVNDLRIILVDSSVRVEVA